MAISGLVLTLRDSDALRASLCLHLRADERLTLGEMIHNRLPVVAETADADEGELLLRDLMSQPGVSFVDVVCVDFNNEDL